MDLFKELIPLLKSGNLAAINELSEEELKKIAPLIGMKVLSAVRGRNAAAAITNTNRVNNGFFELGAHPKLQLMLLATDTQAGANYYPGNIKKDALAEFVHGFYPHWKPDEVQMLINMSSKHELEELAEDFAVQGKDLAAWKKALKERKK